MLEEVAYLLSQGILSPPYFINFVLHTPTQGGHARHAGNLQDMMARLVDCRLPLTTCASTSARWAPPSCR